MTDHTATASPRRGHGDGGHVSPLLTSTTPPSPGGRGERARQRFAGRLRALRPLTTPLGITLKYTSLLIAAACALIPLITVFMAAFKSKEEFSTTAPLTPPANWSNLGNFAVAFNDGGMLVGFLNTTVILAVSLVGTILIGTMTAYAVDRFDFRGRRLVMGAFLLATLVPAVTTQVATFQVVNGLGLFNTHWAAIVLFMGTDIVSIYIFLQFMRSIPRSLDEAAMLDGANRLTIYARVVFPLLRPAIATVVIIKGIAIYNEYYIPFLYMPSRDLGVVSTSLFRFMGPFGAQWEIICAGTVLVIIPTLIAFLLLQRQIYSGLTSGATK